MQYVDRNVGPADYNYYLGEHELLVTKVFYTIQSEGPLTGTPAIFIRLAGCNKGDKISCPDCDTNFLYDEGKVLSTTDLVELVKTQCLAPDPPLVVITGGEPMLQDNITRLIGRLHLAGCRVQIESNGDRLAAGFIESDVCRRAMLVVSPKINPSSKQYNRLSEAVFKRADYLKFIVDAHKASPYHLLPPYVYEWSMAKNSGDRVYVSPWTVYQRGVELDETASIWQEDLIDKERTRANMAHAVSLCLRHGHKLSLQTHLITGVE